MTSQNQQPQGPSPFDRQPGRPSTNNSSWTTTQPTNTKSTPPQQTILPEQKGPGWMTPSRPMPAAEYQRAISTAQMTSSPSSPTHEISRPLPVSSSTQTSPPKRHRLRTFSYYLC